MYKGDKDDLEALVASMQRKWGMKALRKADALTTAPAVSTGYAPLNQLLTTGGIPKGYATELLGSLTSGANTVALTTIANAQAIKEEAAYIDLNSSFDADYAALCGVQLRKLLLVRPQTAAQGFELAHQLITNGADIVVMDSGTMPLASTLLSSAMRHLATLLKASSSILLLLCVTQAQKGSGSVAPLNQNIAVRLHFQHIGWLRQHQDIVGYQTRVTLLKSRFGTENSSTDISIHL
jgi:RecA/RadA recombinase